MELSAGAALFHHSTIPSFLSSLVPRHSFLSLDPRHSSLNPCLLWKQQLDLEAQLPVGTELRLSHVAKHLQLRVDRQLRNRMLLLGMTRELTAEAQRTPRKGN